MYLFMLYIFDFNHGFIKTKMLHGKRIQHDTDQWERVVEDEAAWDGTGDSAWGGVPGT